MNLFDKFSHALPYAEFLARYGTDTDRQRWQRARDAFRLTEAQRELLAKFRREMPVLVLAGAWCGDCANQCPAFDVFAEAAPALQVRFLDRDDHADAQQALLINGGKRVPVAVFFSEDGHEVARYGDRTLTKYRSLVAEQAGEACSSGIVSAGDPLTSGVLQDWLDQFERAQWILRLSPRLRQKHGD